MTESIVYSGSFNPFHKGHMKMVEHLSTMFDKVYLVVSVQNPFKNQGADNFQERFENVKSVIEKSGLTNVIVEDIEKYLDPPYYTIQTLDMLSYKHPNEVLWYCVGGDCLIDFDKWKNWNEILTEYGLYVFPRKGYNHHDAIKRLNDIADLSERMEWHLVVSQFDDIPEISSTEIREKIKNGEDVSHLLP